MGIELPVEALFLGAAYPICGDVLWQGRRKKGLKPKTDPWKVAVVGVVRRAAEKSVP